MILTYTEKRFYEWHEDDISVTLRSSFGSYGGGSEVLVVTIREGDEEDETSRGYNEITR